MFNALQNLVPSHLMDRALFPFETLRATGEASDDGDKAFDEEPCAPSAPGAGHPAADGNPFQARTVIPITAGD
jgi:tRNA 2-thiocytidine biosynthesis protein TtcA